MNIVSIEDTHGMPYFSIAITNKGDVAIRAPNGPCVAQEAAGLPEWIHGTKAELEAKAEAIGKAARHEQP
jgi:hypothetical protein